MFRRKFLQIITMAAVSGSTGLEAMPAGASETVTYTVKGFSCLTCATGLDTLLAQQEGVFSSKSTYPQGKVMVRFDPGQIGEPRIAAFIAELGFLVTGESRTGSQQRKNQTP